MRTVFALLLFSCLFGTALAAGPKVPQYNSELEAQTRCPYDKIVWVNPRTRLWYTRQSRHYANDKWGGFACKEEAVKAGMKQGRG